GTAGVVLGAGRADLLLLRCGDDVLIVDRTAPGVTVEVPTNLDPTRRSGRVTLTGVAVTDVLPGAAETALALARTLFAAEAAGGAPADGGGRRGAGLPRLRARRRAEHPGARRYRIHLGARRPPASAACTGGARRARRRRPGRGCPCAHRGGRHPGEQPGSAA